MKLLDKFICFIGSHDWTCAAAEGIKPTQQQIDAGMPGFQNYATMYCKRCGRVSKLSLIWPFVQR